LPVVVVVDTGPWDSNQWSVLVDSIVLADRKVLVDNTI
jgi:hypothetical protein